MTRRLSILLTTVTVTLLMALATSMVLAEAFTDPVGDTFDAGGSLTTADPFIDLTNVEFYTIGGTLWVKMTLAGVLPAGPIQNTFIEWDMLVDVDGNNATHGWGQWPLIDNGIGVDVLVRVGLVPPGVTDAMPAGGYIGQFSDWTGAYSPRTFTDFQVNQNTVAFPLGNPADRPTTTGRGVAAVRKYSPPTTFQSGDKAPNEGYFTFVNGAVTVVPEFPAVLLTLGAAMILGIAILRRAKSAKRAFT